MTTDEGEQLFFKTIQATLNNYEQRKTFLDIDISLKLSSTPVHRKELHVRLTNPTDFFFLQILRLAEDDFQCLKSQQGLLVDFASFPQKFIDLLELCINEQMNSVPKFVIHFTSSSTNGTLEIVEVNPFKHLVHLSLKFVCGSNEEVKAYLARCLKKVSEEKSSLEEQLRTTEKELSARLSTTQQILSDTTKQLEELSYQTRTEITQNKTHHEEIINREKQSQAKLQQSYEERLQRERLTFEERYSKSVHELENRLRQMQASNKDLTDHKYKYESLIRELKSKVTTLEEERHLASRELQQLRRQNTTLDSDRHERDKTLNHLRTRVAVLEQELKDKEQVISRTNDLLDTANEQKHRLDGECENKSHLAKQLENTIRTISADVIKGNEIIHKLQTEIKALKTKVKMANIVTTKQERLIEEKDTVLMEKEKSLTANKDLIRKLEREMTELKQSYEETSKKFNESQETLKNNENVINWLNKQLNEQTISRLSSTHDLSAAPSSNSARVPYATTANMSTTKTGYLSSNNQNAAFNPRLGNFSTTSIQRPNLYSINQPLHHRAVLGPRVNQQIPHRSILKKPYFQPDEISPIVSHQPMRNQLFYSKQMSTPVIGEEKKDIALDPKYLMRRKPDDQNLQNDENKDPAVEVEEQKTNGPKPFIVASSYFPPSQL